MGFYFQNENKLKQMQETFHTGTDQTPLNFLLDIHKINRKLLPYEFNMVDMPRKEILDREHTFTKIGWVYHFNCIPNQKDYEVTHEIMKNTYEVLYD